MGKNEVKQHVASLISKSLSIYCAVLPNRTASVVLIFFASTIKML